MYTYYLVCWSVNTMPVIGERGSQRLANHKTVMERIGAMLWYFTASACLASSAVSAPPEWKDDTERLAKK